MLLGFRNIHLYTGSIEHFTVEITTPANLLYSVVRSSLHEKTPFDKVFFLKFMSLLTHD